jgi:hypothetical protein
MVRRLNNMIRELYRAYSAPSSIILEDSVGEFVAKESKPKIIAVLAKTLAKYFSSPGDSCHCSLQIAGMASGANRSLAHNEFVAS